MRVVPLKKLDRTLTLSIHLTVTREFRVRAWVAKQLFRLAAWVLGMRSDVKVSV